MLAYSSIQLHKINRYVRIQSYKLLYSRIMRKVTLNLPEELYERLKRGAELNVRTVTQEVVYRLNSLVVPVKGDEVVVPVENILVTDKKVVVTPAKEAVSLGANPMYGKAKIGDVVPMAEVREYMDAHPGVKLAFNGKEGIYTVKEL